MTTVTYSVMDSSAKGSTLPRLLSQYGGKAARKYIPYVPRWSGSPRPGLQHPLASSPMPEQRLCAPGLGVAPRQPGSGSGL